MPKNPEDRDRGAWGQTAAPGAARPGSARPAGPWGSTPGPRAPSAASAPLEASVEAPGSSHLRPLGGVDRGGGGGRRSRVPRRRRGARAVSEPPGGCHGRVHRSRANGTRWGPATMQKVWADGRVRGLQRWLQVEGCYQPGPAGAGARGAPAVGRDHRTTAGARGRGRRAPARPQSGGPPPRIVRHRRDGQSRIRIDAAGATEVGRGRAAAAELPSGPGGRAAPVLSKRHHQRRRSMQPVKEDPDGSGSTAPIRRLRTSAVAEAPRRAGGAFDALRGLGGGTAGRGRGSRGT